MAERIAVVSGVRTPFCKANGALKEIEADDLGAIPIQELLFRSGIDPNMIDEVIMGNVIEPPNAANVARVAAVKGGIPIKTPAYTVNRNCASGLEAIVSGAQKIQLGEANIIIAGGVESMSHFPVLFPDKMRDFLLKLGKAKTFGQKLSLFLGFRPSFLKPSVPEIADPLCSLSMGQTAEILSREFKVTREEQDKFSYTSQQRAFKATKDGVFKEEIVPVVLPPKYGQVQQVDDGPRDQDIESLVKLRPVFDKLTGSVTAGNSSPITDGAAALLLMKESKAKELGLKPLGYIRTYASAALAPSKMGLGPAYAISKVLKKANMKLADIDLIEINEAFAAQVLACVKALASKEFAQKELGRDEAVGQIDLERLNVNGGAIAVGHPLGASGARLVLTLLKELNRRKKNIGIATLCIGGGQGEAVIVEVN